MKIIVNGKAETIQSCTIEQLVKNKDLPLKALVVEHNGRIIKQDQWAAIQLDENDTLELLSFVGGG